MAQKAQGYRVTPLTSSLEVRHVSSAPFDAAAALSARCSECGEADENWVCLTCHEVLCSRYKQGHCAKHSGQHAEGHKIACSLSDMSFWDFAQEAYLDCYLIPELHPVYKSLHCAKFGAPDTCDSTVNVHS